VKNVGKNVSVQFYATKPSFVYSVCGNPEEPPIRIIDLRAENRTQDLWNMKTKCQSYNTQDRKKKTNK
jgi:hypothetical protein